MRQIFDAMDVNFDGVIDREELADGLRKMGLENPEEECERIFKISDLDDNGYLEFKEWCTAAMDKEKMMKKSRLWAAFKMLDKDGNGKITYDEIRDQLDFDAHDDNDQIFKDMIAEIDGDGDGEIDFEEFEQMMYEIIDPSKGENA